MSSEQTSGWAVEEFSEVELGDKRLNDRLIRLCDRLSEAPESPINQACQDWAETKAAYRFFKNENVDVDKILSAHCEKTGERVGRYDTVLAIQDTSYIIYTNHPRTEGLANLTVKNGRRVEKIHSRGLLMHSCLAVSTDGLPLGLLDQKIFSRKSSKKKSKREKDITSIEKKESHRWLKSLQNSKRLVGNTRMVTVCDREADIYEFLKLSAEVNAPVLVRANHDRAVNKRSMYTEQPVMTLWDKIQKEHCAGKFSIEIPYRRKTKHTTEREARIAKLELRYVDFKLNPPKRLNSKLPDLKMYAVHVIEKNPPAGAEPVEWMLLTNVPVSNFEEAYEKVRWYCLRWRIEMYHKVLKSGFRIEECRLSDAQRLTRYLTVMSIIAWRLFMITLIGRTDPETPCSALLAEHEWRILYLKIHRQKRPPVRVPKIGNVVIWIARLGGFLARKSDGAPGTTTLWRGWKRLADLVDGAALGLRLDTCG